LIVSEAAAMCQSVRVRGFWGYGRQIGTRKTQDETPRMTQDQNNPVFDLR
jgi:hypothetical protein